MGNLHETSSQEDDSVDNTDNPLIFSLSSDTKLLREGQVGAVGTSLVPTLGGSSDGAKGDGVPEHLGAVPLVLPLVDKGGALVLVQFGEGLESFGVAGDQSSSSEERGVLRHAVRLGEGPGINDGLVGADALYSRKKGKGSAFMNLKWG